MLHDGLQVGLKCTQMTLGIGMLKNILHLHTKMQTHNPMLNNIFPLHTKPQNYHPKHPNVLRQMS